METENRKSADFLQALALYDSIFPRYQSVEPQIRRVSEFPGLVCEKGSFYSNQGQRISCYTYRKAGIRPAGVVIVAHGLGVGGQCVYMAAADYFTSHGYLVFAYDATGNDDSEGESVIGMEQGIIDLSYAISYVEQDPELGQYPIVLYGHSWGAYCVGAVLIDHPEVRAAVAVAGFNRSADWFRYVADASDQDGSMAVLYTDAARAYAWQRMDELELTPTDYGKTHAFDKAAGYELDQRLFADIRSFFDRYCRN